MENSVDEKLCESRMTGLHDQLKLILTNTADIKESIKVIPMLCDRIDQLERWKDGFWKTVIASMLGAIAVFSGIVALLNKLRF